jgi:hypothetical protein
MLAFLGALVTKAKKTIQSATRRVVRLVRREP